MEFCEGEAASNQSGNLTHNYYWQKIKLEEKIVYSIIATWITTFFIEEFRQVCAFLSSHSK